MPEIQVSTALAWAEAAGLQAETTLAWGEAASLQSIGSIYAPPPVAGGGTVIVSGSLAPLRDIAAATRYLDTAALSVIDLRNSAALPVTSVAIDLADGSDLWTLQAAGNGALASALRAGDQPATVEVTIGVDKWRFVVEEISQPITFESTDCTFRGRSLAAAAGAPYQAVKQWIADSPTTGAQIAALANTFTGVDVDWEVTDWLVPAGAWSASADPLGVVRQVAAAVGAVVEADRVAPTVRVSSRYPVAPNLWATTRPDVQIAWEAVESASQERNDQPAYDGILISGQQAGGLLQARLEGTSGSIQAPMVTDPLLTDMPAQIERAKAVLYSFGGRARETRTLQLSGGVVPRGALVRCVEPEATWTGMVRAVSVRASFERARQTITMERPTSFPAGTSDPDAPPPLPPPVLTCVPDEYYDPPAEFPQGPDELYEDTVFWFQAEDPAGGNALIDNSRYSNRLTLTPGGGAAFTRIDYEQKVQGYSSWYNGSDGYFDTPTAAHLRMDTADFFVTLRVFRQGETPTFSAVALVGQQNATATDGRWFLGYIGPGMANAGCAAFYVNGSAIVRSTGLVPLNEWCEISASCSAGTVRLFLNGVIQGSAARPVPLNAAVPMTVNRGGSGAASMIGYIDNVRIIKGQAVQTASYTPEVLPTATLPGRTVLSLHGESLVDSSAQPKAITNFGVTTPTTQPRFGSRSLFFGAGTPNYLAVPAAAFQFAAGTPFTVEFDIYLVSAPAGGTADVVCLGGPGAGAGNAPARSGWSVAITSARQLQFRAGDLGATTYNALLTISALPLNTWVHVAVAFSGTVNAPSIFFDGVTQPANAFGAVSWATVTPNEPDSTQLFVGQYDRRAGGVAVVALNAYLAELRITKGVARYTATFDPPALTFCDRS